MANEGGGRGILGTRAGRLRGVRVTAANVGLPEQPLPNPISTTSVARESPGGARRGGKRYHGAHHIAHHKREVIGCTLGELVQDPRGAGLP